MTVLGVDERFTVAETTVTEGQVTVVGESRSPGHPNCCPDQKVKLVYTKFADPAVPDSRVVELLPPQDTSRGLPRGFATPSGNIQCGPNGSDPGKGVGCNTSQVTYPTTLTPIAASPAMCGS